ncbi:MAG: glycosyl hydrolase family 28 protein [Sphingomonas sp.]
MTAHPSRRGAIGWLAVLIGASASHAATRNRQVIDVHDHGALGDGITLDTGAIQRAIDAGAAMPGQTRILLRGGHTYLTGPLELKSGIDFHLCDDATLLVSVRLEDYAGTDAGTLQAAGISARGAVLHATGANQLTISGTGTIDGRSPDFMERYDAADEWWIPKGFRPRLLVLEDCENVVLRDVTFRRAPSWTVHLLGCRHVLIEHLQIRNALDVPNCDGIDPDHCQDVTIRGCHIVCGDDAIVIKTTAGHDRYGPSRNITVSDCVLETQDSGLKIGTETTQDIHDILFERCEIVTACRGLCIQLRDQGNVHHITFRDIRFVARHHSAPWWGRGEAISFTAIPRLPGKPVGTIHDIRVENVKGRAENSIRIEGLGGARVRDITLSRVEVSFARWTRYPGGVFDNRPTSSVAPLEPHDTPAISIRHADNVTLDRCRIQWGANASPEFTHAIAAEDTTGLSTAGFVGAAAHPRRGQAIVITDIQRKGRDR